MALPAVARRTLAAVTSWPGMGRSAWMRSSKGPTEARRPSRLIAPIRSAESRSASPSATSMQPMAAMNWVPLRRLRPSLASRVTGASPAACKAGPLGSRLPSSVSSSPSPIMASTRCADGARSPEAPSEPRDGTHGTMSALMHAASKLGHREPDARVAARHGVQPDGHRGAHGLARERRAEPDRVAADQVLLQLKKKKKQREHANKHTKNKKNKNKKQKQQQTTPKTPQHHTPTPSRAHSALRAHRPC